MTAVAAGSATMQATVETKIGTTSLAMASSTPVAAVVVTLEAASLAPGQTTHATAAGRERQRIDRTRRRVERPESERCDCIAERVGHCGGTGIGDDSCHGRNKGGVAGALGGHHARDRHDGTAVVAVDSSRVALDVGSRRRERRRLGLCRPQVGFVRMSALADAITQSASSCTRLAIATRALASMVAGRRHVTIRGRQMTPTRFSLLSLQRRFRNNVELGGPGSSVFF
jgi:hypothetical protein